MARSDGTEPVCRHLEASTRPDPVGAVRDASGSVAIAIAGGRVFGHPAGPAAFNAARYERAKKLIDRSDVVPLEATRQVDRPVVRDGTIARMDVR